MSSAHSQIDLTVVILTLNEEKNIQACLESVKSIAKEILVVDSFSTDATLALVGKFNVRLVQNRFINYAAQRNFALKQAGVKTEWVLMLDADERVSPELSSEIKNLLGTSPRENGFEIRRRLYWYGKWIKKGYYPVWLTRLVRTHQAYCEDRVVNEHLQVEGQVGRLQGDILHEDQNGIDRWHTKHLRYAELEAEEFFSSQKNIHGIKRWVQYRVWDRLPLFLRPWIYFLYRYVLRGGFLEGWQGLSYHFFQSLWLQFLISLKITEMKRRR